MTRWDTTIRKPLLIQSNNFRSLAKILVRWLKLWKFQWTGDDYSTPSMSNPCRDTVNRRRLWRVQTAAWNFTVKISAFYSMRPNSDCSHAQQHTWVNCSVLNLSLIAGQRRALINCDDTWVNCSALNLGLIAGDQTVTIPMQSSTAPGWTAAHWMWALLQEAMDKC